MNALAVGPSFFIESINLRMIPNTFRTIMKKETAIFCKRRRRIGLSPLLRPRGVPRMAQQSNCYVFVPQRVTGPCERVKRQVLMRKSDTGH